MQIREHDHFLLFPFKRMSRLTFFFIKTNSARLLQNQTRDQKYDTQSLHWLMHNKKYITKILTRSSRLSIVPTKHRLVILND